MASRSKRRMTIAKREREQRLRERRALKEAKRLARKDSADSVESTLNAGAGTANASAASPGSPVTDTPTDQETGREDGVEPPAENRSTV
jgi:hypothetical protein